MLNPQALVCGVCGAVIAISMQAWWQHDVLSKNVPIPISGMVLPPPFWSAISLFMLWMTISIARRGRNGLIAALLLLLICLTALAISIYYFVDYANRI